MPGRRGHGFDLAFLPMTFADFCRAFNLTPSQAALTDILADESSFRMYEMEIAGDKNKLDENECGTLVTLEMNVGRW